jgi:hypothetical protein
MPLTSLSPGSQTNSEGLAQPGRPSPASSRRIRTALRRLLAAVSLSRRLLYLSMAAPLGQRGAYWTSTTLCMPAPKGRSCRLRIEALKGGYKRRLLATSTVTD